MFLAFAKRDLIVGCTVPGFNFVVMNPADQISLTSPITIPKITTPPMAHHDSPPSKLDSIYLDPNIESRPLLVLSQQTLPSYNQKNGELFFLFKMQICHSCVDHRVARIEVFNAYIPVYIPQAQ